MRQRTIGQLRLLRWPQTALRMDHNGRQRMDTCSRDCSRQFRHEHDLLGGKDIPVEAYWGIHTSRALDNFQFSEMRLQHYPVLLRAYGSIKRAAARVNARLGLLSSEKARAIELASRELEAGLLNGHFPIDIFQGGAGTS